MKAVSRVHITPHMHWDREWYFTTEESRILLVNNMEEILCRLEQDNEYKYYVLDGQTAILEDYFAVKPENKDRVKKLVEGGKLIIGPWYTQTDTTIVSAESIVRNLMYGMRDCLAFGEPMKIGYLPDSFGMSGQLPHIYNGFGITRTMFWRGCSERHGTDKTEFLWQSSDGSEVTAQVLPLGYAIGKYLPADENGLRKRLDSYFDVLEKASVTKEILLPNGHDQMPLQQNIFEVMEKLREIYPQRKFVMSRFEEVFEQIEAQRESLAILKGEFIDGKYMRVHRTIGSTRMDIKIAHARIENKIVNLLEPLATLAWTLGFDYHHGLLEKMWKEILKNHAHDSIGCCCSDKVHREIVARFELAEDMADNLIRFYMRKIADNMPQSDADKLVLFNLMPWPREEVINTTVRLRGSQFNLRDGRGQPVPYFIRHAREIDPGLIERLHRQRIGKVYALLPGGCKREELPEFRIDLTKRGEIVAAVMTVARMQLTQHTPMTIVNANAAIAWEAMLAGSKGFCGVFANFHPDLYHWLWLEGKQHPEEAKQLAWFLSLSAVSENIGYPKNAKIFHQQRGTFDCVHCRVTADDVLKKYWGLEVVLKQIADAADFQRQQLKY